MFLCFRLPNEFFIPLNMKVPKVLLELLWSHPPLSHTHSVLTLLASMLLSEHLSMPLSQVSCTCCFLFGPFPHYIASQFSSTGLGLCLNITSLVFLHFLSTLYSIKKWLITPTPDLPYLNFFFMILAVT